ncbi:hypothetical protein O3P69_000863 [Scylla paramamosain]|uniref:Uncharacterized protein n=1 Tax=Scylla paramamosain TaxID=85552 RepID=A0AAW0USZ9_SCYPA
MWRESSGASLEDHTPDACAGLRREMLEWQECVACSACNLEEGATSSCNTPRELCQCATDRRTSYSSAGGVTSPSPSLPLVTVRAECFYDTQSFGAKEFGSSDGEHDSLCLSSAEAAPRGGEVRTGRGAAHYQLIAITRPYRRLIGQLSTDAAITVDEEGGGKIAAVHEGGADVNFYRSPNTSPLSVSLSPLTHKPRMPSRQPFPLQR